MKTAIVTGITGMDGSHLCDQLIEKGFKVYGIYHRSSAPDMVNIGHLVNHPQLEIVEGDLLDLGCLTRICKQARADYFFNMAAMSHVGMSFDQPNLTAQVTGIGVLNCLEAIRLSGIHTRFLQASTSEMFGGLTGQAANEETPFHPRSPYGCAKLYGYWITINYRESYKMFACNSICFNHEGPRRHHTFVTRKITKAVARIKAGLQDTLYLGNLEAKRDWGFAPDFTQGMIKILGAETPEDYVLATGETHTVREFCDAAFSYVGLDYNDYVQIDPKFYRPAEVNVLIGDYGKIEKNLGWKPTTTFTKLVGIMVQHDLGLLE